MGYQEFIVRPKANGAATNWGANPGPPRENWDHVDEDPADDADRLLAANVTIGLPEQHRFGTIIISQPPYQVTVGVRAREIIPDFPDLYIHLYVWYRGGWVDLGTNAVITPAWQGHTWTHVATYAQADVDAFQTQWVREVLSGATIEASQEYAVFRFAEPYRPHGVPLRDPRRYL